jgi:photosystem II stability/assembly factor-like uncharacterized protein
MTRVGGRVRLPRPRALAVLLVGLAFLTLNVPPAGGATLFGLVDTGELYASVDNGAAWSVHATLAVHDAVGLAAGTSSSDLYLATRSGSIYRSTDGGTAWSAVGAVTASDVAAFTILPSGALVVLTATGALHRSINQGASFDAQASLTGSDWVSLLRGPLGRLYALTRTGQVAESADGGATWTTRSALPVSNAVSIQRLGATLYVMVETGEFHRSLDYGTTWTPVAALTSSSLRALAERDGMLVAATREGEVARSSNGTTWSWVGAINQLSVVALGTDTPLATGVDPELASPRFAVRAPYPNPAAGEAGTFAFTLDRPAEVTLELYDVRGRLVASRVSAALGPGPHALIWSPMGLGTGRYLVRYMVDGRQAATASWTILL